MADWAISPTTETDWQLDPDDFARRLLDHWPEAVAEPSDRSKRAIEFTVPVGDGSQVEGYLAKSGKAVWFDGDVAPAAEVAAWLREQVPADQELSFYDQAYEVVVPLTPGVTPDEIVAAATG
jgi:hypothetical protein